jgi:hypothetical protein
LSTRNEEVDKRLTIKDKAIIVSGSFKSLHTLPHDKFSATLAFLCLPSRDIARCYSPVSGPLKRNVATV